MARPIWNGTLSFGLLNVPVALYSGERTVDLHFRMLDAATTRRCATSASTAETGEEVPWKEIVKAFEYDKGSYVVLDEEDIRKAAPREHRDGRDRGVRRCRADRPARTSRSPTAWCPQRKPRKATCCCARRCEKTGKVGIARVVIRTREYLAR